MIKDILKNLYLAGVIPIKYKNCKIRSFVPPKCKVGNCVKIGKHSVISKNAVIGNHVVVENNVSLLGDVEINDYTYINEYTKVDKFTGSIGKYCSISLNVKIGLGPHPKNFISTSPVFYSKERGFIKNSLYSESQDKGYSVIEHDVWIGANAMIMAGVNIGTGAIVAAGSIVTKDVPPYAIVAGVPAKIINYRFDQSTIDRLLESKWWNLDLDVLLNYSHLVSNPIDFVESLKVINKEGEVNGL